MTTNDVYKIHEAYVAFEDGITHSKELLERIHMGQKISDGIVKECNEICKDKDDLYTYFFHLGINNSLANEIEKIQETKS